MLRNVDLTTSGKFRCEVSGEAPLFQTATHTNVLIVVGKLLVVKCQRNCPIKHPSPPPPPSSMNDYLYFWDAVGLTLCSHWISSKSLF